MFCVQPWGAVFPLRVADATSSRQWKKEKTISYDILALGSDSPPLRFWKQNGISNLTFTDLAAFPSRAYPRARKEDIWE